MSCTKVFLDVETTGLDPEDRIIEIGLVETLDDVFIKDFHQYFSLEEDFSKYYKEAVQIHGINKNILENKKPFKYYAEQIIAFVKDKDVYAHNAPFDLSFINKELAIAGFKKLEDYCCKVIDTLEISRGINQGSHSLSSLARKYGVKYFQTKHSAIIDAFVLSQIYSRMTIKLKKARKSASKKTFNVIKSTLVNLLKNNSDYPEHEQFLDQMYKNSGIIPLQRKIWKKKK